MADMYVETRVLVCGSRTFASRNMVASTLTGIYQEFTVGHLSAFMAKFVVIEGGAAGADAHAAWWADQSPMHSHNEKPDDVVFEHHQFPADWNTFGKAAGPIRNQQMLTMGRPSLCIAFIDKPLEDSRGTADMVGRCVKAGVRTQVIRDFNPEVR